ncbi:hypothetical protein EV421DRAFT_2021320 [Armillaria borealis]|uniref:Uncharacterized protein n=1 Tax=Armillaria borealis TaxID=47425 RepID=A0AA39MLB9_9AGAR|nr:hypothetical protein EV421DRAFT_2021320 [Armillaria borealis]
MTDSKPQLPPRSSNAISSGSHLAPPPPYSEDIERGVNETSPLYPTNPVSYTLPREITDAYQSTSTSSSCKTLRTILVFSILAIVLTLYLHERTKNQFILDGLTWTELTPSNRCLRYSTREYSALLRGVPSDKDGLKWCKMKEITIHRIEFKNPAHCTIDVDKSGTTRAYGHWIVKSNEPRCMTTWEDFRDKARISLFSLGCAAKGSKYRISCISKRIEAQMGNYQPLWDNWREMCSTTPADYEGHHFDRPDSCERSFFGGVTGVWFFKDESC